MDVIFERVDARRYRIGARRNGRHDVGNDISMRSAPGAAAVPHDLVHFVVEEQAGLRLGIFGQVAAGGDVGGFFRSAPGTRRRVDEARRSRRIGRAGRADVARSEQLAALVDAAGQVRTSDDIDAPLAARLVRRLDDVLRQWRTVPAGGRLVLPWPDALTIRHGVLPGGS